jgi:hypothetical protein
MAGEILGKWQKVDSIIIRREEIVFFRLSVGREKLDQSQSVEVDWNSPVLTQGLELEPAFGIGAPGDDGVAIPDQSLQLLSDHFADAFAVVAYVDAGTDLNKPRRQPST